MSVQIKFQLVINSLDTRHIDKIAYILTQINHLLQPYETLKHALTHSFEASETFKINKLMTLPTLDQDINPKRPTELLMEMRGSLETAFSLRPVAENLLRRMFVDKLPTQVRVILAALPELSLDELAKKAESIMQVAHHNSGQAGLAAEKRLQPEEINNHLTQILINQHLEVKLSRLTEAVKLI